MNETSPLCFLPFPTLRLATDYGAQGSANHCKTLEMQKCGAEATFLEPALSTQLPFQWVPEMVRVRPLVRCHGAGGGGVWRSLARVFHCLPESGHGDNGVYPLKERKAQNRFSQLSNLRNIFLIKKKIL